MRNMNFIELLLSLLLLVNLGLWLYFKSYSSRKGSNQADIEDARQLALIRQGVKDVFDKDLESYKSELNKAKTIADWRRDEYKQKVFLFQKLGRLIESVPSVFKYLHALKFGSSIALAIGAIEGLPGPYMRKCFETYDSNLRKAEDYYSKVKDLLLDLSAITYELDIYFNPDVGDSVRAYISNVENLISPAISEKDMQVMAKDKYFFDSDIDKLRGEIGSAYDQAWMTKIPNLQAVAILNSIRDRLREQMAEFH